MGEVQTNKDKATAPKASVPLAQRDAPLTERIGNMTVQRPTFTQLKDITLELGMHLSDEQIKEFLENMQGSLDAYDVVDGLPDYLPPVLYPRTSGTRPTDEENPLNAWYIRTEVRGAPKGPLLGKTVALKDNVCLAGVPMMNGASTLKGYTPDVDATVVTRLLDAGATIAGKAHCEYYCFLAAATQMLLVQFTTLSNADIQLVGLLLDPRPLSRANTWIWRSVVIRGVYSYACILFWLLRNETDPWPRSIYWYYADRKYH